MSAFNKQAVKDLEFSVSMVRLGLKICGIWPDNEQPNWQRKMTSVRVLLATFILIFFTTIPTTMAMPKIWGDMTLIIDNFIINFPYFTAVVKLVVLWYKEKELGYLFNEIKSDWTSPKNSIERNLMMKNAKIAKFITVLSYVLIIWVMAFHHLPFWVAGLIPRTRSNLTDPHDRALVMQTVYFHDVSKSPNFEITAVCQTIATLIAGSSYTVVDCVFVMLIMHVSGQLAILTIKMENMCNDYEDKIENDAQYFVKTVRSITQTHQKIIRFVTTMESVYSFMILEQFSAFAVIFAVTGFQLISIFVGDVQSSFSAMSFAILYFLCTLSSIFMYSAAGEFLIFNSQTVSRAIYSCKWYNLRAKDMGQLLMVIIRTQKPLSVSVGKFAPVSLITFSMLIKTSASYLSVLLAMKS
uniref:Odorant receptor n=1 Tax=Aulacocentrum confusum TaxID=2767324 RepID=A0A7G8Z931_9HYME|nr:olfactory receptor 12 [Aulacocentrum confusum]